MEFEQLINNITPEIYSNLKRAIEIGKWADGRKLSQQQKESCMEAVLNYEQRFVPETERVGYIDRGSKADGAQCDDDTASSSDEEPKPLKWS